MYGQLIVGIVDQLLLVPVPLSGTSVNSGTGSRSGPKLLHIFFKLKTEVSFTVAGKGSNLARQLFFLFFTYTYDFMVDLQKKSPTCDLDLAGQHR
jgi:hypothetical protein